MGLFNRGKKENKEEPQDFVLFGSEENAPDDPGDSYIPDDTEEVKADEDLANTAVIDISELEAAEQSAEGIFPPAPEKSIKRQSGFLMNYILSHKGIAIAVSVVLAVVLVAAAALGTLRVTNPLHGYAMVAADKGNIMKTMDVEGTLATVDKYEITSLVAGKIIESELEIGDSVNVNDVLYRLDDTEAKLAVERAKNEVDRFEDSASVGGDVARILATEDGVVQSLTISAGSHVSVGMKIGTIKTGDGTILPINSYIGGTVVVVSVSAGRNLSAGQVIATVRTDEREEQIRDKTYDKRSAEIDLQTVQRQLENYTIKSPVSGVVIEKNKRVGDNIGITDMENPMMVILDTSKLAFTFAVDEYMLNEIERGQSVGVNVDSISDTTFSGEITSISNEGRPGNNGTPIYDVTATITEPGELKAGMNVKAKVVLNSVNNAIYVPQNALMETDGQKALVFVRVMDTDPVIEDEYDESVENQLNYPWIKVPKGCRLISVKYGLSDGINVQILSGLKPGDIVVFDDKAAGEGFVEAMDPDDFDSDRIVIPEDTDDNLGASEGSETEDAAMQEKLRNQIESMLSGSQGEA